MRLFVAVRFSDEMKKAVRQSADIMRDRLPYARFSRDENLHVTLAFIGEVPPSRLAACSKALDGISFRPFDIALSRYGSFPGILWMGLEKSDALDALAHGVRNALGQNGFRTDAKPFRPHITLARECDLHGVSFPDAPRARMTVSEFSLMESRRERGRLVYDPLFTVRAEQA